MEGDVVVLCSNPGCGAEQTTNFFKRCGACNVAVYCGALSSLPQLTETNHDCCDDLHEACTA